MKKHDLPSMPFYWGDWFKAMDLQSLPRETRCVWFEMLGRMWESNERGYLTINGKPMSDFAKASALGFGSAVDEYLRHERILEEAGIFSRRKSDKAIFSRKVLNDIELSQKRAEAGSKGGKKTWHFANTFAKANGKANTEYEYEDEDEIERSKDLKILEKRGVFKPPTISEVQLFCQENKLNIDAERFVNFYASKGWLVGRSKMKSWQHAVRNAKTWCQLTVKTANSGKVTVPHYQTTPENLAEVSRLISETASKLKHKEL